MTADPNTPLQGISPSSLRPDAPSSEINNTQTAGYTTLELWLHRISVLMFVFVCATIGVFLIIFPWRPEWTDNRFLLANPSFRELVSSGFVRGLCSGLGLLDIWIGFWEAVHYHEEKHS